MNYYKIFLKLLSFFMLLCYLILSSANKIKIGYAYFDPPYIISPSQGFEVDLVKYLCKKINSECEFIPMNMHQIFAALQSNKIDLAFDSMNIVENLPLENYIYSSPYLPGYGQFLARSDYDKIENNKIPKNAVFGLEREREVITEGIFHRVLFNQFGKSTVIRTYNNTSDLIHALEFKKIDIAFLDKYSSDYWIMVSNNKFVAVGQDLQIGDGIGLISVPKHKEIMSKFDTAIKFFLKSGEFKKLYDIYL